MVFEEFFKGLDNAQDERERSKLVIEGIEGFQLKGFLMPVNQLLKEFDPFRFDAYVGVAVLRSSSRNRRRLSEWAPAFQRTWLRLHLKNENPERLLRGMKVVPLR